MSEKGLGRWNVLMFPPASVPCDGVRVCPPAYEL